MKLTMEQLDALNIYIGATVDLAIGENQDIDCSQLENDYQEAYDDFLEAFTTQAKGKASLFQTTK